MQSKHLIHIAPGTDLTMSSLEIAELTGKRHDHVLRDIDHMLEALSPNLGSLVEPSTYADRNGVARKKYDLPKDLTLTLVTGYSVVLRKRIVDRWIDLEQERLYAPQPPRVAAIEYVRLIKQDLPGLGQSALQQLYSDATEIDLGRRLIPLPVIAEKHYTATELAEEFGVSATKIGRTANVHGLKTAEFGEFRLSKSRHSAKQVEQFYYNENGRQALVLALSVTKRVA